MTAFTGEQYEFAVQRLAEGEMPTDVASALNVEWKDAKFTARDVAALTRDKLPKDWQGYFDACRAAFVAGAPTSDTAFRVALLDKMARDAAGRNSFDLARQLIELIEKIQSGYFAGKGAAGGSGPADDPLAAGGTLVVERTIVDPKAKDAV